MFALLDLFTTSSISDDMWQMLGVVYETFTRDGFDYFVGKLQVMSLERVDGDKSQVILRP